MSNQKDILCFKAVQLLCTSCTCGTFAYMGDCAISHHALGASALSALRQALQCAAEIAEGSVLLLVLTAVTHHLRVATLLFEIDLNMASSNVLQHATIECKSRPSSKRLGAAVGQQGGQAASPFVVVLVYLVF